MEAIRDRYTVCTAPVFNFVGAAEKGASTTPLLNHSMTGQSYKPLESPPPRRSRIRKIVLHLIHISIVLGILYFFMPRWHLGGKHHYLGLGDMSEYQNNSPGPRDCVTKAEWTAGGNPTVPHFHYYASTSLELPRLSSLLHLISRGTLSHGAIEIVNDGESADKVKVEVGLHYNANDILDEVDVCTLKRGEDKNGVGIFSPNIHHPHPGERYRTTFNVKVRLPASDDLQYYEDFETDMPLFAHSVGDLGNNVFFRSVSLKTTNDPIDVTTLSAERSTLRTTNSPIKGVFNVTDVFEAHTSNGAIIGDFNITGDISLITSNSPIKAKVNVTNRKDSDKSKITLSTSNSPIDSQITLTSAAADGIGGAFDVRTVSTNGLVNVVFPFAPVDVKLDVFGRTSNSPLRAKLPTSYEGSFSLHSSPFEKPAVHYDQGVDDPAGRGRTRNVSIHRSARGVVEGDVKWSDGDSHEQRMGNVQLSTTNSGVRLEL